MGSFEVLPVDILQLIAEKIAHHVDVLRFAAVCRIFRSIIHDNLHLLPPKLPLRLCVLPNKPPPLPLLMHCHDNEWENVSFFSISDGTNYGDFLLPEMRNKYLAGSGHGWLFTVDIQGRGIQLLDPLTRAQIPLPSLDAFQHPKGGFESHEFNDFGFIDKAIILSNPSSKRRNLDDDDGRMLAMSIISNLRVLSFCRVGDDEWTNVEDSLIHIQDVIRYKGQVYAIDYQGLAVVCDFAQIANSPYYVVNSHRYLVESTYGDLLQVVREINNRGDDDDYEDDEGNSTTYKFLVYKLEAVEKPVKPKEDPAYCMTVKKRVPMRHKFNFKWVKVKSLGDQALFLGKNNSLCVRASEYQGCKPNCIYFTEQEMYGHTSIARGFLEDVEVDSICDMGIYDFEEESFQDFSELKLRIDSNMMFIVCSYGGQINYGMNNMPNVRREGNDAINDSRNHIVTTTWLWNYSEFTEIDPTRIPAEIICNWRTSY
ncbi:putative F-box protein At1g65770 [Asparagus officinalis]|uniref:putative F-box protein At1g65770 n=1 Tax=Asparagus officinalis TaxID=4686 RepID=UPI00098E5DB6|nr:putative F-box protein At1g65770 [Asparagus officinalis]